MKKVLIVLLIIATSFSCQKKSEKSIKEIDSNKTAKSVNKNNFVSVGLEDIITHVSIENRNLLISELQKPHKHNEFLTIETDKEPITIVFEIIDGKHTYTGVQNVYNSKNEKSENTFTTLNDKQIKKLKETGYSGWKD